MQVAAKQVAKREIKKQIKKKIKKKIKEKIQEKIKEKIQERIEEKVKEKIQEKFGNALERRRQREIEAAYEELYFVHGADDDPGGDDRSDAITVYIKYLLGFAWGCGLIYLLYLILVALMGFESNTAVIISAILGLFISFGLAFSRGIRCIVLLIIPTFFASKGRTLLMIYGLVLVSSGPMMNINHNMDIAHESMACGISLAKNQSQALHELMTSPLTAIANEIEAMVGVVTDSLQGLIDVLNNFKNTILRIIKAIKKFFQWLKDALNQCKDNFGSPEMLCRRKFEELGERCRERRKRVLHWACNLGEELQFLCAPLAVLKVMCVVHHFVAFVASRVSGAFDIAIDGIEMELWVYINYTHHFELDVAFDKSINEMKTAMLDEVKSRTRLFSEVMGCVGLVLSFSSILIIIKAMKYRSAFLVKDNFDNMYQTKQLKIIDERRRKLKKPSIFPLKKKERFKYPTPGSVTLSRKETRKLRLALFKWGINILWVVVVVAADYAIYEFFSLVSKHAELRVVDDPTSRVQLVVNGYGSLATIYKKLIDTVDPSKRFKLEIDTTKCLPLPNPPDTYTNTKIAIVNGICLVGIIFESYGLRFRRVIAGFFYPERERERGVWLYNHILRKRGTFSDLIWDKLHMKDTGDEPGAEKVTFANKLASKSRILREIMDNLGYETMLCYICGHPGNPGDRKNFRHCENAGCKGVFCLQCIMDISGICTRCMFPVEYDVIDIDIEFERDSSEDELNANEEQRSLISKKRSKDEAMTTTEAVIEEHDDRAPAQ